MNFEWSRFILFIETLPLGWFFGISSSVDHLLQFSRSLWTSGENSSDGFNEASADFGFIQWHNKNAKLARLLVTGGSLTLWRCSHLIFILHVFIPSLFHDKLSCTWIDCCLRSTSPRSVCQYYTRSRLIRKSFLHSYRLHCVCCCMHRHRQEQFGVVDAMNFVVQTAVRVVWRRDVRVMVILWHIQRSFHTQFST